MPKKRILVLGASALYIGVIEQLKSAGFTVIAADRDGEAAGGSKANEFICIDIADTNTLVTWARENRLDGVMPINDFGVVSAAHIASALNLSGNTCDAAEKAIDKAKMRIAWNATDIRQPEFRVGSDLESLLAEPIASPSVMKPADSGGAARGISFVHSSEELEGAYRKAKAFSRNGVVVWESKLEGTELSIECMVQSGNVSVLAVGDKWMHPTVPWVTRSIHYPAAISKQTLCAIESLAVSTIAALGLTEGMVHLEAVLTAEGLRPLELGARGGGGHIFHTIIEAVTGINAPVVAAKILSGESVEFSTRTGPSGCAYRFLNAPAGLLKSVEGLDAVRSMSGVLDVGLLCKVGDHIQVPQNGLERVGYVVATGANREHAIEVADQAETAIRFVVDKSEDC